MLSILQKKEYAVEGCHIQIISYQDRKFYDVSDRCFSCS